MRTLEQKSCFGQQSAAMNTKRSIGWNRRAVAVWLAGAVLVQAGFASVPTVDDTARVLAGLAPSQGSPLEALTSAPAWKNRSSKFSETWQRLEDRQLSHARVWAGRELTEARKEGSVLYYAFSGPDILYANTFFPGSETYVLCGLEPVGAVPDLLSVAPDKIGDALSHLHGSLDTVLALSFFITKDMSSDLRRARFPGTTPILLTFLARLGKTVLSAGHVSLDSSGNVLPGEPPAGTATADGTQPVPGVKITFTSGPGAPVQTLYYFSTDISNGGLKQNPAFANFCRQLGPGAGFVKAASYLMHGQGFTTARDLLLERCKIILQDDTGVPVSVFLDKNWQVLPYGRYKGPIRLFGGYYQKKLASLYAEAKPEPLKFGISYHYRTNECNMVLAKREGSATGADVAAAQPPAPEPVVPPVQAAPAAQTAPAVTVVASADKAVKPARKMLIELEAEELRIRADESLNRAERNKKLREIWDRQLAVMGKTPAI